MAVPTFTLSYVGTPPYFSGTSTSALVPNIFPIAIDGRPYMIDQKSGKFQRGYEQRVRDSQDISTAPGEAAINPGGLWRRGQDSWHLGAGQQYADAAESKDFMFYKSKGVYPWTKGQISLLNATLLSKSSSATASHMVVQDGRVYASLNGDVFYSTNPFSTSATWTACTGEPGGSCQAMATDGNDIYLAFPSDGVRKIDTSVDATLIDSTKYVNSNDNYYMLGFAKNFMWGAYSHKLATIASGGSKTDHITPDDLAFTWVGVATGQNAIYAAGYSGKKSLIYKITITSAGVLDKGIVALELPTGEVVSTISGYLGFILVGTNKGVRYCSTDSNSNLVAGPLIPTSGPVYKFTSDDRFSWFTWSNYDGTSGGLGRLDLSVFTATNLPAFATDLMYDSTNDVKSVVTFADSNGISRHVFMVSGVGIIAEDSANLVTTAQIESGTYRWGIPDRKFVAKVDTRANPLAGSITPYLKTDNGDYEQLAVWNIQNETETSSDGTDQKAIEAAFKFVLTRESATAGPTMTRWMARAYVAPYRSQFFIVPILLHESVTVKGREYYYDVDENQNFFDSLIDSPRIVTLQIGQFTHTVIVDDVAWESSDARGNSWSFDGTLVVTLRSVEN